MFKPIWLGFLLTLASNSHVDAGVVTVWGEEKDSGYKVRINNFYNSSPGTSSSIATGDLTTVDLTATNLLWVTQPADAYTPAELAKMASFVASGGRIAFMGEHGTFTPNENIRINTALAFLGSGISINNVTLDADFRSASVADGQILSHPLLAGVLQYEYACFAPLTISGGAQALMLGEQPYLNKPSVMMGYENIGPGSVFLITDQNVWDNAGTGWPGGYNNSTMFQNLLNGNTAVDAPTTNPVNVTNLTSPNPTISWTYIDFQGDIQQKYEVEVWTGPFGTGTRVWDPPFGTGTANSVVYAGIALTPAVTYYARVRASDAGWGNFSEASFTLIGTNTAPTTNPVAISNPASATPTIGWTYHDAENNPQVQYEMEVRTGPSGTGASFWHPAIANGTATTLLYSGPALVNGQTYYARVKAYDGSAWGAWSEASWVVTLNRAPDARAGRDSTVYAGTSCRAELALNGSATTDPDGDPITYAWTGPFSGTLTGVSPTVSLAVGTQNIFLAVTDSKAAIGRDTTAITVLDSLKPIPTLASLPDVTGSCSATLNSIAPTATDNCKATITATTADSTSFATQGTRIVHWTYADDNGNTATQNQTVIVRDRVPPIITRGADTSITLSASMLSRRVALKPGSAIDSCSIATSLGTRDDGLPLDSAYTLGATKVQWKACDNYGNCDSAIQNVTLIRNRPPVLVANLDTAYQEKDFLRFLISVTDSDGTLARISTTTGLPPGGSFVDSGNGKASLLWPRDCNDHCLDRVTIRAYDGMDSVSDLIIVQQVDKPAAIHPNATPIADSTLFPDSICVQFTTAIDSATLHYVLSGPGRDTSSFLIGGRQYLCVDRTVMVTVFATRPGWINSLPLSLHLLKMDTVARPVANVADSTFFRGNLCITLTTTTPGALIHYTLDGGNPDTSSMFKASGDSVCIDRSLALKAVAKKINWVTSPSALYHYQRMEKLSSALPDIPGGTLFSDSLCIRFFTNTGGATLWFTLDGSDPLLSSSTLPMGAAICLDTSTTIRTVVKKADWINSDEAAFTYLRRSQVAKPTASRLDSTYFRDSLCVRFSTTTDSASIHYVLNGGRPDTSALTLANNQDICFDKTTKIDAVAMRPDWVPSRNTDLHFLKMDTAAIVSATPGDSTYFRTSQCITLASATPGTEIHYALDGRNPDSTGLVKANGDTVCFGNTLTVRALARKANWVQSPERAFHFIRMQQVATPASDKPDSTWFADSLCVRLTDVTPGAQIRYSVDGGKPDTSALILASGQTLCRDRTTEIRVIATKPNWIPSEEIRLRLFKMDTVAVPIADKADSTYFRDSICVNLSDATVGAEIHYTLNGFASDTAKTFFAGSGRICFEDTVTLRAMGQKQNWINSPELSRTFIRMQQAGKPKADKPDSLYFSDSTCVRFTSATAGVRIRYTLHRGIADTSSMSIGNGESICLDSSATLIAVAEKTNWINSDATVFHVFRMETVQPPDSDKPDSTYFKDSLCVQWTIPTPDADIHLTTDGGAADTATAFVKTGYSICMDRSTTFNVVGKKANWKNSATVARNFFRMQPAAKPGFDRGDTVFYPTTCVKLISGTEGADLHYTLDGGNPDTSSLVKHGGDTLCVDRTLDIKIIAKKKNWLDSEPAGLHLEKMDQVAAIHSNKGDSAVFAGKLCLILTSVTDSVRIAYSLDGGDPLASGLTVRSGETLCLERSAELVAVGTRPLWRNSLPARFVYEADNQGPDIFKAEKRPYSIVNLSVSGTCRGIGQDTLVLTLTEKLTASSNPPDWKRLAVFSPRCDLNAALPVPIHGPPAISADSLTYTILLDNASSDEVPMLGNCIYLEPKSSEFVDRVGNRPDVKGARLDGREKAVQISQLRAYPPVVGLGNASAAQGCLDEGVVDNSWIPPYGYDPIRGSVNENMTRSCNGGESAVESQRTAIPACASIMEVVSDGSYVADISIFDHLGNFVFSSRQQFGACGELDDPNRSVAGKKRSYLVWNTRDNKEQRVGNGVYVWRINFLSVGAGGSSSQKVVVRTGFLRGAACND